MTGVVVMQERIGELCHQFKLPTMGARSVSRFTTAGHGDALPTFLEVLEKEAEDRRHRRISRLRKEAKLPSGKTWETFDHDRMPMVLRQQLDQLAEGSFVDRGVNVLAFGLPGTGKTHALCAVGHRLVEAGRTLHPKLRTALTTSNPCHLAAYLRPPRPTSNTSCPATAVIQVGHHSSAPVVVVQRKSPD